MVFKPLQAALPDERFVPDWLTMSHNVSRLFDIHNVTPFTIEESPLVEGIDVYHLWYQPDKDWYCLAHSWLNPDYVAPTSTATP